MKLKISTIPIVALAMMSFVATAQTINDPYYEASKSGIYSISKIDLTKKETRVYIHNEFIPHWWVQFNDDEMLIDSETGEEYKVIGIEGAKFGEKLWMPESGDSTIVLIFPPLDKKVKKIDFNQTIFGVSLDKKLSGKKSNEIPDEAMDWINSELAKASPELTGGYDSESFFQSDTARLVGFLKGYDPRLGFSTGILYMNNVITREDYPIVLQIHPDGRFEADLPFIFPQFTNFFVNRQWIPIYLEPGQALGVILDWEEFLIADRRRNIRYQVKDITYLGPLAKMNSELAGFEEEQFNYQEFQKKISTMSPEDFNQEQMTALRSNQQRLEDYAEKETLSANAKKILANKILLENATRLFDFISQREYAARQDSTNEILQAPVSDDYYGFLKEFSLNDASLLIPNEFNVFINRFEYCPPFMQSFNKPIQISELNPEKDFAAFLKEEKNIELSDTEEKLLSFLNADDLSEEEQALLTDNKETAQELREKYNNEFQEYFGIYLQPLFNFYSPSRLLNQWEKKDSVLVNQLGLSKGMVYDITKIRSLGFYYSEMDRAEATDFWGALKSGISHSYLLKTGDQVLENAFPGEEIASYELPAGAATNIFKEIIKPFEGKILFVDFWATSCGPCIASIRNMKQIREQYKDNPDFEFIFITDLKSSPEGKYNEFVQDQDLHNTFRISEDDYNHLRQLFRFNGIPRYVVIDRDGRVIDGDFPMHNFSVKLPEILARK